MALGRSWHGGQGAVLRTAMPGPLHRLVVGKSASPEIGHRLLWRCTKRHEVTLDTEGKGVYNFPPQAPVRFVT